MRESLSENEEEKAREYRLHQAIENNDVAGVHELIAEEPELLDRVSKHPFQNTPLHLAAASGKTQVAMEMAILMPSFTRKLNPEGYSPMHLALQHKHYQIARALITIDPELIRIRGRGGITPLHYVAGQEGDNEAGQEGDNEKELLFEFLFACKSSIEDLTSRHETAVHIVVKNHNLEAFNVLFGWLKRVHLTEILNWKDENGNTVLHIAILEKQPEIIKPLIGYTNVIEKNFQGKTALEIFQVNPSGDQDLAKTFGRLGRLSGFLEFLSKKKTVIEYFRFFGFPNESARNIIIAVATIIATATYQAALTPPGGYWQENSSNPPAKSTVVTANSSGIAFDKPHQAGNVILNGSKLYQFVALNSTVFFASIVTIWITAIPLWPRTLLVYFLTGLVGVSFFATAIIQFQESDKAAGYFLADFYLTVLLILLVLPICLRMMYTQIIGGTLTNATWRRVGNL